MRRWYNRSIRNKLTAVVLLSVIPALLIASVLGAFREADHQGASRRAEFQGIANALAAAASEPLAAKDRRQVANALKGIGAIPNLTHISVRDSTGLTVFQFGTGILVSQNTRRDVFNLNTHPVEAEIRHAGKPIGRLLLIADISDVSDALSRSLKAALIAGVMSALAGLLASYRMQRAVATPIAELKQAMSDVRHMKDFTRTVTRSSHDETGELVDAFNSMMGEINTRDRALADHRAGLENEVRARTHDLAEAVDAAQSANRAKSEFLATMSHEIRTPMNGMLVMAELLAASELTPRAQRHCEVILRSGQTLLSIINDILDLSKIEAGHLTLERVSVVPAAIVDDIVKLFSERAASKGLQLAAYVAPDVPAEVVGDPVRLSQILSNLVNNALKFTEAGGVLVRVDVGRHDADSVEAWEAALRFSVIDNGIGIPADKLASIFDPFTQAEASTTRRFGGTGIGLTICRKLADAMGGALRVESVLGAGSTFSFELPMDGNAAHAQSVRDVDSDKDRRGAMMLAIPAGPVRTTLSLFAAEFGLDVRATDAAAPSSPRVIVTDLDGLARVREVRVDAATCPVILLTRMGESAGEALLKRGAVQGILEVPFSSAEAREAIDAALAGRVSALHLSGHEASPVVDHQHFKGVRVLAADDSPINREVLIEALRRLGADVTCVDDGAAAFEAVKRGGFDLVFMDGSMPVLDGFDATRAIRAWEAETGKAALPVVGLSAHVFGDRAEVWRACGMTDFITKPFTLAAIRMCLERTVGDVRRDAGGSNADDIAAAEDASGDNAVAPLIDPTVLQSIRDMQAPGDDLVARVTTLYVEHAPKLLEKVLALAAAPADMAEIASAAHALKSLSRNVGAVRVGDLSGAIEDAARGGACAIAAHSDAMRQAVTDTIAELQSAAVPAPATQRVA